MVDYDVTDHYGLKLPKPSAWMNTVAPDPNVFDYLDDNFTAITDIPSPPSVTGTLPQSGNYNIGDRVYHTDEPSIYILVVKDALWGWHWKPIHAALSPWVVVPASAIILSGYSSVVGAKAFSIAFDNRGRCHWRGGVKKDSGTYPSNSSLAVFADLPAGMHPRNNVRFRLTVTTFNPSTNSGIDSMQGARLFLPMNGGGSPSLRVFQNGSNTIDTVYFGGTVEFSCGELPLFTGA